MVSVVQCVATLGGVVLKGGFTLDKINGAVHGAGLHNERGQVTLINSRVMGNCGVNGGGVDNWRGAMTLINTSVDSNRAISAGGGVMNLWHMVLIGSRIANNSVVLHNVPVFGLTTAGGLYNFDGDLAIVSSLIAYNEAGVGGGLFNYANLTVVRSSFQGNIATRGGGLYVSDLGNSAERCNVTGTLLVGTSFGANHAEVGKSFYSELATGTTYLLPAPTGSYVSPVFECTARNSCGPTFTLSCAAICDTVRFQGRIMSNISAVLDTDFPYACPLGSFCDGMGPPKLCPPGQLGNVTGLRSPVCNGLCPKGSYCGAGCTAATPCKPGRVGNRSGLTRAEQCDLCPPGHWCSGGQAFACGINTYANMSDGLRTSQAACVPCDSNAGTTAAGASSAAACLCTACAALHQTIALKSH